MSKKDIEYPEWVRKLMAPGAYKKKGDLKRKWKKWRKKRLKKRGALTKKEYTGR